MLRITSLILTMALALGLSAPAFAQTSKPAAQPKAKTAKAPAKKAPVAKKKAPVRRTSRTRRTVSRRAPAPQNQRMPSKERYAEIQQALADAGYFTGEPNGVWMQDSVDALRAFQYASGFEPTGKIDARSLIKLGLGPTYGVATTPSPTVSGDTREPG